MTNSINSKIASYIGLAIRAGKALFGEDKITEKLPSCAVVLIDELATDKYKTRLLSRCGDKAYVLEGVRQATHREEVLAIGITDSGLGKAIIDNLR